MEKYIHIDDFKKEILTIYCSEIGSEIPESELRKFLDCLLKNLDKKIVSNPEIREKLVYLRIEDIHQRMIGFFRAGFLYMSLISVISILIVFSLISQYRVQNLDPLNYILSSISQGLAAIFALVFTITLVATQMLSKYSIRATSVIFSFWTVLIMFIFAVGIIVPLVAMKWQSEFLLDFCIVWAGICIFLLIPYFFYLKERLSPAWLVKSFLQKVGFNYIEQLGSIHEMRTSQSKKYISYESDKTGARCWLDIQNDPLLVVPQIMIRILREGDYETFISSLTLIQKRYQLTVKRSNSRYLGFQFLNTLTRISKELIKEDQDFLLLRLCFILRTIAVFNANRKLPNLNTRISSLMGEYLGISYLEENFSTIRLEIQEIINDICTEYVKNGSRLDFLSQVAELRQRSEKIVENASPQEIFEFMNFIRFLATIALIGKLAFLEVVEDLANCMKGIGIESARRDLRLPHEYEGLELRLSEWSVIYLERIRDDLHKLKNQKERDERYAEKLSMLDELISKIVDYVSEIRRRQESRYRP